LSNERKPKSAGATGCGGREERLSKAPWTDRRPRPVSRLSLSRGEHDALTCGARTCDLRLKKLAGRLLEEIGGGGGAKAKRIPDLGQQMPN